MALLEQQIQILLTHAIKEVKKVKGGLNLKNDKKDKKLPNYYPIYQEAVFAAEDIRVHTEVGRFPERLFKNKAPNQTDKELEYIKGTFKEITMPVTMEFFDVLNRIWNKNNFSVTYGEDANIFSAFPNEQYFEEDYPIYGSLINYFRSVVTTEKIKDANALMVIKPHKIPVKEEEQNGEIVLVPDDSQILEPIAKVFPIQRIISFKENHHAFVQLEEKSKVKVGQKVVREGLVYELYDEVVIWRIEQVGKKEKFQFEIFPVLIHELGFVPVIKLKGFPIEKENDILYQSPLTAAIKPLDLALMDSSMLQIAKNTIGYPRRWEITPECEFEDDDGNRCIKGKINTTDGLSNCPECKGTGTKNLNQLMAVYSVKEPRPTEDELKIPLPPFGRETADTESMKFARDEIELNKDNARELMKSGKTRTKITQSSTDTSATGRAINREDQFAFILGISNEIFELLKFAYKAIGQMRYGEDFEQPEISPPTHFEIRTLEEVTLELSDAVSKGLPQIITRKLILEYIDIRFGTQPKKIEIDKIVLFADRLATLSENQISIRKGTGGASNVEVILHNSSYNFIAEAIQEDDKFLEKELNEQADILMVKAREKEAEVKADSAENGVAEEIAADTGV